MLHIALLLIVSAALIEALKESQRSASGAAQQQHILPWLHTSDSAPLLLSFPPRPCLSQSLCISAER